MNPSIQKKVAQEAGVSFETVVKRYAAAGHSINETATLLGYASPASFRRMCIRYGWVDIFKRGQDTIGARRSHECRIGIDTPALAEARARRKYKTIRYQGIDDTVAGHCRRLGLSYSTVKNRQYRRPGEWDYIFSAHSHVTPPDNSVHHWRRDSL